MSQLSKVDMPAAETTERGAIADRNLVFAAALLAVVIVLIAAQWVFATNNPGALDAATNPAVFGIIGP